MAELTHSELREKVRERYAAAARGSTGSCCGTPVSVTDEQGTQVFGSALYGDDVAETELAADEQHAVGALQAPSMARRAPRSGCARHRDVLHRDRAH